MKKTISAILTVSMIVAMFTTAFAAELNQDSDPKIHNSEITTSIKPTYVVTIPADTKIEFNATSTTLGTIKATHMQIELDKKVVVNATAGKLENQIEQNKTIAYKLMQDKAEFSTIDLIDTEKKADLSISIDETDWNEAYAGDYQGTITFTISYENQIILE